MLTQFPQAWLTRLTTRFLPASSCLLCQQSCEFSLCDYCKQDLDYFDLAKYNHNLLNWPSVKQGLAHPGYDSLLSLADYQWPFSSLLTQLKFNRRSQIASTLAQLFCEHVLTKDVLLPQAILPIPLHWRRLMTRRYNQSELIAHHIANNLKIVLASQHLSRVKATRAQSALTAPQRRKNLKQAFALNHPIPYKHIALFDDVVTTGATTNSIVKLIQRKQPDLRIDVWSICLTLKH